MLSLLLLPLLATASLAVPTSWYQDDHSVSALFARDVVSSSITPGSDEWRAAYPSGGSTPPTSAIPKPWLDRLARVVAQPNFPKFGPSAPNNGYPQYNGGSLSGASPEVCSFTYACVSPDDVYNAKDGTLGLSFDDGPLAPSQRLYPFLAQNNVSATHFMIGGNVLQNPDWFKAAVAENGHIAVHTWSHPYMTSLSNEAIVAELGFTMDVIASLNGGRIPSFWRPPFGDVDNRVRAIASGVFGLTTVVWNQDSADWAVGSNPAYTHDSVIAQMTTWLTGPKSPGLVILEHELSDNAVTVFLDIYKVMVSNGWKILNVAESVGMSWYENAATQTSEVITQSVVASSPLNANGTTPNSIIPISPNSSTTTSSSSASSSSVAMNSTSVVSSTVSSTTSGSVRISSTSSTSATRSATGVSNNTSGGAARVGGVTIGILTIGLFGLLGGLMI